MKKLLIIVASALTFGAFAGDAGDTPIVVSGLDAAGIDTGDTIALVRDGETIASTTYADQSSINFATEGAGTYVITANDTPITSGIVRKLGSASAPTFVTAHPKTVGEEGEETVVCNNTVLEQNFVSETETTTLPEGWTAPFYQGGLTPLFKLGANGALVYNNGNGWKRNALQTACAISSDEVTEIDVVTYADSADRNVVIFLASSDYSVAIGNSYNSNKEISIGSFAGDASGCFVSFQNNTGTNPNDGKTEVAASGAITVGGPLTYHMVLNGTSLTGTVSDGTTTKDISFTLPETYSFSTIGLALDGPANGCGVKSITVKNDQEPTREPMTVYATSKAMNAFVDAEGTAVEELVKGDTIVLDTHMTGNVWGGGADISGLAAYKIVVDREMDLGGGNGIPEGMKITINYGDTSSKIKGAYLAGDIGANAKIDGTGILVLGDENRHTHSIGAGTVISCRVGAQNDKGATDTVTINGAVEISGAILGNVSFKLADGATLKVAEELTTSTVTTDVSKRRIAFNETTKTYSLVEQITLKIPVIEHTVAQYHIANVSEWTNCTTEGDYNTIVVDKSVGVWFQYVSEDETKWTVSGNQSGYHYTNGLTSDTTYDAPKTGITVTAVGPVVPGDLEDGSDAQKTAYVAWAAEVGIDDPTVTGASEAFALSLTAAELEAAKSVEKAVEDKLDTLITDAMLAELVAKAATGDTVVTIPGYENATFTFKAVTEIETSAKLFRLAVEFKPSN